jgi:hypothetical protein
MQPLNPISAGQGPITGRCPVLSEGVRNRLSQHLREESREANTMDWSAAKLAFIAARVATSAKTFRNLIILRHSQQFAPVLPIQRPSR